jgi:hypothetical protein
VKAQPRELDIKRVLFATSLTKENDPAVAYALSFARERSANLTVLHALPDPAETQEDWEVLADIARDKMKALVAVDDIWPRDADVIVEPGDASLRILEYATLQGDQAEHPFPQRSGLQGNQFSALRRPDRALARPFPCFPSMNFAEYWRCSPGSIRTVPPIS